MINQSSSTSISLDGGGRKEENATLAALQSGSKIANEDEDDWSIALQAGWATTVHDS
jgi:hypothetical protein